MSSLLPFLIGAVILGGFGYVSYLVGGIFEDEVSGRISAGFVIILCGAVGIGFSYGLGLGALWLYHEWWLQ